MLSVAFEWMDELRRGAACSLDGRLSLVCRVALSAGFARVKLEALKRGVEALALGQEGLIENGRQLIKSQELLGRAIELVNLQQAPSARAPLKQAPSPAPPTVRLRLDPHTYMTRV
jgi:hypothetical protein